VSVFVGVAVCILLVETVGLPSSGFSATHNLSSVAENVPWSGYWWPVNEGAIVKGYRVDPPSPIEKYDLYASGMYPGIASSFELTNSYDIYAPPWWGYCFAWANASVLEPIDFVESASKGIFFSIGDKKGLVTLSHADDPQLLQPCNSPVSFHQYLLEYIGEQKMAFVADLDSSEEVWAYPIYSYEMTISESAGYDDITCSIRYADDNVVPDFVGTQVRYKTYTYMLEKDSSGDYIGGTWTGNSIEDHPEFIWIPVSQAAKNPYLDYAKVLEIVKSTGDDTDSVSNLTPGHYAVVIHPGETDALSINAPSNSSFSVSLVLDRQRYTGMVLPEYSLIFSESGTGVSTGSVTDELQTIHTDVATDTLFLLNLSSASANPRPDFIHVYVDISYAENQYFLNPIENGLWSGIALTNHNSGKTRLYATYLNSNTYLPRVTFLDIALSPNAIAANFLNGSRIPADNFTEGTPSVLRISSDASLEIAGLKGDEATLSGPPKIGITGQADTIRIVPELSYVFGAGPKASLTFYNPENGAVDCGLTYLTDAGSLIKQYDFSIPGSSRETFLPGAYPGKMDINGWALFTASSENIIGNVKITTATLSDEIPLLSPGTIFYAPLLAVCEGWQTWLTLFNTSPNATNVALKCYNGLANVDETTVSLAGYGKKYLNANELFDGIDNPADCHAWLQVLSSVNVAGFITYKHEDNAISSVPLYDETKFSTVISLGLAASDSNTWWTGILILNPSDAPVTVNITGYDQSGLVKGTRSVSINAKENYPVTIEQLFGDTSYSVEHLKIGSSASVAVFALYGNKALEYISGAVLH